MVLDHAGDLHWKKVSVYINKMGQVDIYIYIFLIFNFLFSYLRIELIAIICQTLPEKESSQASF